MVGPPSDKKSGDGFLFDQPDNGRIKPNKSEYKKM